MENYCPAPNSLLGWTRATFRSSAPPVLPEDTHPTLSALLESNHPNMAAYLIRLNNQPKRCFFHPKGFFLYSILPGVSPVYDGLPSGTNLPASSRKARVHRAAKSKLCVTRIEVRP